MTSYTFPRKLRQPFVFLGVILLTLCATGCLNNDAEKLISERLQENPRCLITYGAFPITLTSEFAPKYAPVLDEFVRLGYATTKTVQTETNHDPDEPSNIVDATYYELTAKGEGLSEKFKICYGEYEILRILSDELLPVSAGEHRMVGFEFQLTKIADWVDESDRFVILSDQLYNDLHTREVAGKGSAVMKLQETGIWKIINMPTEVVKLSEDPTTDRNRQVFKEKAQKAYRELQALEPETPIQLHLAAYEAFLHRYPGSEYHEEIRQAWSSMSQEMIEQKRAYARHQKALFEKLISDFGAAIDHQDNAGVQRVTLAGTAARNALNNNLFDRYQIGPVAMTSYKYYGDQDKYVQMQVNGGIRMVRAEKVDQEWLITGYETQGNHWFKQRDL